MNDRIPTYSLSDFTVPEVPRSTGHTSSTGVLQLNSNAEPPSDKFDALMEMERKFKTTWRRTRTDLTDSSASGWDMALANLAVEARWTDQEVANLIIASRRMHGDDLKLRQDYYGPTIAKARILNSDIDQFIAHIDDEGDRRVAILQYASQHLGVAVHGMICHPGPPDAYRLKTELGDMPVATIDALMSPTKFRNLFAERTKRVIPVMGPARWGRIAQALLEISEDDVISDLTEVGRGKDWIEGYLAQQMVYRSSEAGAPGRHPFHEASRENRVCIFGDQLHVWLVTKRMERVTKREMGALLRLMGCDLVTLPVTIKEKRTTRSVWLIPE